MTESYHITNFGSLASRELEPDIDGYVHLTAKDVLAGRWDAATVLGEDEAEEIAQRNREATVVSVRRLAKWRARLLE